jgi:hypothetical protein
VRVHEVLGMHFIGNRNGKIIYGDTRGLIAIHG